MKQYWKMVKLGEVLKLNVDSVDVNSMSDFPFAGVYSFGRGLFKRGNQSGSETSYKTFNRLHKNQIIVSKVKGWEGAIAKVEEDFEGLFLSPICPTFDLISEQKADIHFIDWFLKQEFVWQKLLADSKGIGARRNSISEKQFLNLEIPLPSLSEQKRIAGRLAALKGKIDAVRVLRGEQVREVERVENQFLNDLFDSLRQRIGTQPIEKVAILERGRFGHRPRNAPHLYENGTYPFIQTGEVSRAKGGKIEYSQTLNEEGLKVSRLFKSNTVLMTIAANIGNTAILDFEACFPDSVVSIRPKEDLDIYFLDYYLRGQKDYLNAIAPQSAQKNINVQILSTLKIPVPPISEQRRIVSEIQAFQTKMEALKAAQAKQSSALEGLVPGVLEKAFRGEW